MCGNDCFEIGPPPPDTILSLPPPPLPAFLLPRSAIVAISGNESQPCFAAFICQPSTGHRDKTNIEFIESPRKGIDDSWIVIIISSCVGVLFLGVLLAMLLIKCRDSYNVRKTTNKPPTLEVICESHVNVKPASYATTNTICPCSSNTHQIQRQLASENRMLWATLTPHGTRHYITEPEPYRHEEHYEVIDSDSIRRKFHTNVNHSASSSPRRIPIKSFDNSAFIDYEYDGFYNTDDLDSGYQEPHEILETLSRSSPRPLVSSPTRIEHPNMAPLNMHPHSRGYTGTLSKRPTIHRRTSETSSHGTPNN
ncbi:uncharacterized protein LOC119069614 [Bradysia coprophila]|uniref:uncharacterized protein LOC119069614 n=1 Tax=Bradysia coprophila TaxID=38358 RepID=UPI00187DC611|nr:uncharacterized protein LOC119069614 [Bradysia coprophila]